MIVAPQKPTRKALPARGRRRWPQALWVPVTVTVVMLLLGLLSLAVGRPLLFPSLAPATITHVSTPHLKTAGLWNTVAGQYIAIAAAYFGVWAAAAARVPSVMAADSLPDARLWATLIGLAAGTLVQVAVDAVNPAAAATALLITLGAFRPTSRDAWTLVLGVAIMALLGEAARRLRLAQEEAVERTSPRR